MKTGKQMILISILVVMIIVIIYSYTNYFGPQYTLQTNHDEQNCKQGNIFDGVDRQARFSVLSTCKKVIGIVHDMKETREDDGDFQFNLELEPQYEQLLNNENIKQVKGMLVIEIISKDQGTSVMHVPKNGDKIEVYGAWVTDNPHGWNEIHPAWKITILN